MSKRALFEWESHIRSGMKDDRKPICGAEYGAFEFMFVDVGHWFLNHRNNGRLRGCPDCVAVVAKTAKEELGDTPF